MIAARLEPRFQVVTPREHLRENRPLDAFPLPLSPTHGRCLSWPRWDFLGAAILFTLCWSSILTAGEPGPRVESGGRVVVLDDFENGLGDWEGDAKLEMGQGAQPGSKALVWRCTDVPATIRYKFADRIPNRAEYTRIALDMRGWDDDGLKGPGVAIGYSYFVYGGLPWQLPGAAPTWGLWDRRPVFGDQWRSVSYHTHYPEWYNHSKFDNTRPRFSIVANTMAGNAPLAAGLPQCGIEN